MKPSFSFEKKLWEKYPLVIGVDEVGRGALAGTVVAGAVAFNKNQEVRINNQGVKIDDSKRLKPKERIKAAKWIKENCLVCALGSSPVSYINKYGIVKATNRAFRIAIKELLRKINKSGEKYLLVDAFHIKYVREIGLANQKAIVKGDQKSISIASASIIAKVHRDRLMTQLARKNKKYSLFGWGRNKGYGTKEHIFAIKKYGPTLLHRKLFLRNLHK